MASDWLLAGCALAALCLPLGVAWWLAGRAPPRARPGRPGEPVVRSLTPPGGAGAAPSPTPSHRS